MPEQRPIALNDLPYPSQVRLESADGHFLAITDPTGRAGFPEIPVSMTLANLFIEQLDARDVPVHGYQPYGCQIVVPASPVNDWWATPIPAAYPRPLSSTWHQLPILLKRI